MLTRSVTANTIINGVESLHLTCDISSSPSSIRSIESEALDTRAGPPCSRHLEHSFTKPLKTSCTSNALTFESCTTVSQTSSHLTKSLPKKKSLKTPHLKAAAKSGTDREAKIRELKGRALKIKSTGNAPASEHQRLLLMIVFDEITPYPDESWLSYIAVVIRREYNQVKNWFSNQRQKEARANRENTQRSTPGSPPAPDNQISTLCKFSCEGRPLRLRPKALQYCKAEDWSDQFFEEVIMIHNFKILTRLRRVAASNFKNVFRDRSSLVKDM